MISRTFFLALVALFLAVPSYSAVSTAGQAVNGAVGSGTAQLISNLSANVIAEVISNTNVYSAVTKATKGDKIYATSSQDTSIWVKNDTANDELAAGDGGTASDGSGFIDVSGWTEM